MCYCLIARHEGSGRGVIAWRRVVTTSFDDELLTIAETARLLKVSRVTVQRWLKAGRLAAVRVGPKAIRIRRGEIARITQPLPVSGERPPDGLPTAVIYADLADVPPWTEAAKRRARAAIISSRRRGQRILAQRGGVPLDESWPMIREAREERSRHLL